MTQNINDQAAAVTEVVEAAGAPNAQTAQAVQAAQNDPTVKFVRSAAEQAAQTARELPAVQSGAANLPANMADINSMLMADSGRGTEEADGQCFSVPYLVILQATSPVVMDHSRDPSTPFRAGVFYNTATGTPYNGVDFIPVYFQRRFNRWTEKNEFMGTYLPSDVETGQLPEGQVARDGYNYMLITQNGTDQLADSRIHYVLVRNPETGTWEPAVFSLSRSQIKHSKRLLSMIRNFEIVINNRRLNPPSWASIFRAETAMEQNDNGTWYGWSFTRVDTVTDPVLYQRAKDLYESIKAGTINAAEPAEDTHETDPEPVQQPAAVQRPMPSQNFGRPVEGQYQDMSYQGQQPAPGSFPQHQRQQGGYQQAAYQPQGGYGNNAYQQASQSGYRNNAYQQGGYPQGDESCPF